MTIALADLAELIRARRTSMLVDHDREVPVELVGQLCELAAWAPNHKRTWPWRFALFTGEGRARLGEAFVADMVAADFGDEQKRTKTATKYLRTPAVLIVACAPPVREGLRLDDRDAVAAGIQNVLLGATAVGLATYWSTPPLTEPPTVLELCQFDPGTRVVGVVYVGWPNAQPVATPVRPAVEVLHVSS
jgi:nitroreductase